jgi:DNA-binding GntR family transcriptional regulator
MQNRLDTIPDHLPLADAVFESLSKGVIDGRLEPGMWLRQEALAQELGVSQMPVREALKRLVAEGLAERIPYKGVRIVEYSPEDIVDICTNRLVLESLAIRFATPLITEELLQRLRRNIQEIEQNTGPEFISRRRELNAEFHLSIYRACGRQYLIRLIELLWKLFPSVMLYEGMLRQIELLPDRLEREVSEHKIILSALEKRDAEMAENVTRQHIRNLSQELTEVLGIPQDVVHSLEMM